MILTHKSQEVRAVKCRKCYIDMKKHLVLDLAVLGITPKKGTKDAVRNYDWICERCGLRHRVRGEGSTTTLPS